MRLIHRVIAVVVLGLVPVIAVAIYNSLALQDARRIEVNKLALQQAEYAASEVDRIVEGVRSLMTAVAQAPSVKTLNTELCSTFIRNLLSEVTYLSVLTVADAQGKIKCAPAPDQMTVNIADRNYFQQSQKVRGLVVGDYVIGRVSKKPVLPFAMGIIDNSGKHIGAVVTSLDLDWLSAQLLTRGLPDGGSVTVADRNGVIIARQPEPSKFVGQKIPDAYMYLLSEPQPGVIDVLSQDGTSRVLGYMPVNYSKPRELYLSAGVSRDQSYFSVNAAAWRQASIALLAVLTSLGSAYFLGRFFIVTPLEQLLNAVHKWQAGDMTARTGLKDSEGEVGKIGQEFDRTLEQLGKRQEAMDVLLHELSHRSKNQLALMLGFTKQLAKGRKTVIDYRDALTDRFLALSASQDLLLKNDGHSISLETLLQEQLRGFEPQDTKRIQLAGPSVILSAECARILGMAIHELATNATKYGALSNDTGTVEISWTAPEKKSRLMEFKWVEHGGPVVAEPSTSGFGRTLIEKIVPLQLDAEAKLSYFPVGLSWIIKLRPGEIFPSQ